MRLDLGGFAQSVAGAQDMHRQRQLEELNKRMAEMQMQAQQFALQQAQAAPYLDAQRREQEQNWWREQLDLKTQAQVTRDANRDQQALELFRQKQTIQAEQAERERQAMRDAIMPWMPSRFNMPGQAPASPAPTEQTQTPSPPLADLPTISNEARLFVRPLQTGQTQTGWSQPWTDGHAMAQAPQAAGGQMSPQVMQLMMMLQGIDPNTASMIASLHQPPETEQDIQQQLYEHYFREMMNQAINSGVQADPDEIAQQAAAMAVRGASISSGADMASANQAMMEAEQLGALMDKSEDEVNSLRNEIVMHSLQQGASPEEAAAIAKEAIDPMRRQILEHRMAEADAGRPTAGSALWDVATGTARTAWQLGSAPAKEAGARLNALLTGLPRTSPDYIAEAKGELADLFGASPAPQQALSPYLTGDLLPVDMAAAAQRIRDAEAEDAEGLSARALADLDWLGVRGREALLKMGMGAKGATDTLKERIRETGEDIFGAPAEAVQALEDVQERNASDVWRDTQGGPGINKLLWLGLGGAGLGAAVGARRRFGPATTAPLDAAVGTAAAAAPKVAEVVRKVAPKAPAAAQRGAEAMKVGGDIVNRLTGEVLKEGNKIATDIVHNLTMGGQHLPRGANLQRLIQMSKKMLAFMAPAEATQMIQEYISGNESQRQEIEQMFDSFGERDQLHLLGERLY